MTTAAPVNLELHDVPVHGGAIRVARRGHGDRAVLAVHGLAGSHITVSSLARDFDGRYTFLAPDLRGRGASAELPGPYGLDSHVRDCLAVLRHFGFDQAELIGHSLGAFIIARLAAQYPDAAASVNLVDGGIPFPAIPEGADPDEVMETLIGPVVANLSRTFPSVDAYLDLWRQHPALGGEWSDELEARFRYEITEDSSSVRPRTSIEAVKADQIEGIRYPERAAAALEAISCPLRLFRASRGILNQPEPTISNEAVIQWQSTVPGLDDYLVADTNHLTVTILPSATAAIAGAIGHASSALSTR